ncbi:MAG: AraC-like DNA-binding protein, partial [Gammaproteobacteria bacterium]
HCFTKNPRLAGAFRNVHAVAAPHVVTWLHDIRDMVGVSPIDHLTIWRMQMAGALFLSRPELSIVPVAQQLGFASEWAFAKAFK